jgi:TatD DNase family protein
VLETDSPYLAPVPHRGKRNESAYLDLVVGKLVNIYNKDFAEIDRITTENAEKLFA